MILQHFKPLWAFLIPIIAWVIYFFGISGGWLEAVSGVLLIGSVLAAVHHAEEIAHKLGEPFGTIVLALAITIIEVALIISLMIAGGPGAETLPRDTVFAAIMLILNGILGLCLLIGGAKFHEQYFGKKSANTALITLVSILVLTLVLPNYTTSIKGPYYNSSQLVFVAIVSLILYGSFVMVQTVRHKDYFISSEEQKAQEENPNHHQTNMLKSLVFLTICLGIVVLLAKALSPSIEGMVTQMGAPKSLVGVIIAAVVLLPESIAALKAARKNQLQTSVNLALGSALASIGLTIPAVAIVCLIYDIDLVLGIDIKSMVLLALSFFIVMLALNMGKTNLHYGVVLLVSLAAYIFTVIVP
ncbi:calcium:proton antiporter [Elizabethkingia sp. JS20170427COW]|uniref:calcium:proton antiporter n=1 Tax=Elizabethkingia sp. JS20170427COW TaxID=2583851 RepID=UPI001110F8FE|nr:ionic transporter y4hA [Elizabethkingia sp. JS20170427COW]QCX53058.1 ionic transporter y4hA [Elizabethkingia sp. JS20170427COW]